MSSTWKSLQAIQKIFKHFQVIQLSTRFSALSLSSKRFIFETIIIVTHSYQLLPKPERE